MKVYKIGVLLRHPVCHALRPPGCTGTFSGCELGTSWAGPFRECDVADLENNGTMDRRDLLKKGAVAGGLVWAAPVVFTSTASAAGTGACPDCLDGNLYGIKNDSATTKNFTGIPGGPNPATCVTAPVGIRDGTCWDGKGVTWSRDGNCHIYTLGPALSYCEAMAKGDNSGGDACAESTTVVTTVGSNTVVRVCHPTLSHSEIIFCAKGTDPVGCP